MASIDMLATDAFSMCDLTILILFDFHKISVKYKTEAYLIIQWGMRDFSKLCDHLEQFENTTVCL